ncbi:hypothetical protein [Streptomyces sp. NPDC006193]|uniref:hypothetical protein n=1 Tax=Streptomyces sp. NPDC006193 TaxID=3155717 RepID=UPI0033BE9559
MTDRPTRPRCGNDPRAQLTDGDRQAVAGFRAYLAARAALRARITATLARQADADVQRVTALYERWVKAGPPPLGVPIARWWDARLAELHDAILPPTDQTEEQ